MKIKTLLLVLVFAMVSVVTLACNKPKETLVIWVGAESATFYQTQMDAYIVAYNEANDEDFPYIVEVKPVDTGTAAGVFLDDQEAGPDIFTVAHDNLGRLVAGSSAIAPVTLQALIDQINNDNPASFQEVIRATVGGTEYIFGIPYVAQSLVLYYNNTFLTEANVQTWEGIWGVAKAQNKRALTITGTDGFNNSFLLLSTRVTDGTTSLRLYQNGVQEDTFGTGDDTISVLKWGQRFFMDSNGAAQASSSGWEVELKDGLTLSVIGGAWHFNAAKAALGENLGIAILPKFTITAEDAYGTVAAGTQFQSGSFTDTKMFVMKKNSPKAAYLQDILLYLSSKQMQELSFNEVDNLPAYKNAATEFTKMQGTSIEAKLAAAQVEMFAYGIPQPFGFQARYNVYYYQKGAPDIILAILRNVDGSYNTFEQIKARMTIVETIWKTGQQPAA
ncbi:MAG: hypothetical protein U1C51_07810 [Candidatus Izemoplasmatales bacterium]|nr:hypothetical protein [bacterium]MDZ4197127.1 hypothetical protein [Candidatus Izemoplasmatales bacterium]